VQAFNQILKYYHHIRGISNPYFKTQTYIYSFFSDNDSSYCQSFRTSLYKRILQE